MFGISLQFVISLLNQIYTKHLSQKSDVRNCPLNVWKLYPGKTVHICKEAAFGSVHLELLLLHIWILPQNCKQFAILLAAATPAQYIGSAYSSLLLWNHSSISQAMCSQSSMIVDGHSSGQVLFFRFQVHVFCFLPSLRKA